MKVIWGNSPVWMFLNKTKSYNLRNLNLKWNRLFLRLKGIREIPYFVGFSCNEILQSEKLIVQFPWKWQQSKYWATWNICYKALQPKHLFYSLPHFVASIMVLIPQSEECEFEWNTKNSPDWRKSKKFPHFVWFSLYPDPTIWGIWVWNVS